MFVLVKTSKTKTNTTMLQFKSNHRFDKLQEICLSENEVIEKTLSRLNLLTNHRSFFIKYIVKVKGYDPLSILKVLFVLPYLSLPNVLSIYKTGLKQITVAGKDVFYELKNNNLISWRKFLYSTVRKFIKQVNTKAEPNNGQVQCLIVDDTLCEKSGKQMELIGRVFDHVSHKYLLGFKILVLGLWDGKSFLPIDFSIHGEKGKNVDKPQGMTKKEIKARFQTTRPEECASSERVEEYFKSKSENAVTMCKRAIKNGIIAQYVLADSWFINAPFIDGIRKIKKGLLHVIGMSKTNRKFEIGDKTYHAKALIARHNPSKKTNRKLKMQYFTLNASYKEIPLKLFFVKQGYGNTNDNWKLIVSTDLKISFQKAMETYQIRWTIEVFFKDAKQNLYLGKCQSNYFNAQVADTTICFIQYILLALHKRFDSYETIGGAFRNTKEAMLELTLADRILEMFLEIMKELVELLDLDYEIVFERLLNKNSSAKILALLNALKNNDQTEVPELAVA
jgi:hypothetical protein